MSVDPRAPPLRPADRGGLRHGRSPRLEDVPAGARRRARPRGARVRHRGRGPRPRQDLHGTGPGRQRTSTATASATPRRRPSRPPPRRRTTRSAPSTGSTRCTRPHSMRSRPPLTSPTSDPHVPELPEVEVVRAGLERHVVGATITRVDVLHPRPVRRDPRGPAGFATALAGRRIESARRRGKYLWLPLDNGDALLGHLGMSGQMLVQPPSSPDEKHLRVRIALEGAAEGRELRFVDQRMFGGLSVSAGGAELPAGDRAHRPRPARPGVRRRRVRRRRCASASPASSGSCSTRTSSPGSATSTPTRRCGGPGSTASVPATG